MGERYWLTESHLLQMRGLKPDVELITELRALVASFTDAWIETNGLEEAGIECRSHLLQMRGLKRIGGTLKKRLHRSHLLQMRGLKHLFLRFLCVLYGRIFYRCVD